MVESCLSRAHSRFNWRRRIARSLATRSRFCAKTYSSPSCGNSLTCTPGRASCHGLATRCFSKRVRRPFGVPTRMHRRVGGAHLGKHLLGRHAAIHQPDTARFAVLALDALEKTP